MLLTVRSTGYNDGMKVALCTRNRANPVIRLLQEYFADQGWSADVLSDPRALRGPATYDAGFWRPDSRDTQVAAYARQVPMILEGLGVPFINSLQSCDIARNKVVCAHLFAEHHIPTPFTVPVPEWDRSLTGIPEGPIVAKPVEGKASEGVHVYAMPSEAEPLLAKASSDYLIQEAIDWSELIRVIVSRKGVVRTYIDRSTGKRSLPQVSGFDRFVAEPVQQTPTDASELASQMLTAVGGDLMRADLMRDRQGNLYALEINSSFGFPHEDMGILGEFVRVFRDVAQERSAPGSTDAAQPR